jgi:hypothetical protein
MLLGELVESVLCSEDLCIFLSCLDKPMNGLGG